MTDLAGRTALITGASSGIGRAAAQRLAASGMRVALVGRNADRLESVRAALGDGHVAIAADLSHPAEADRVVAQAVTALGRVDVLFANAGLYLPGDLADTDPDSIDTLINVNVTAVFPAAPRAPPGDRKSVV